jgi:hypothetical protein
LSCILFFAVAFPCSGQNATVIKYGGTVFSQEKGEALSSVVCKLLDDKSAILSYALSDSKGDFSLEGKEPAFIMFELLGYKQRKIDIKTIADNAHIKVSLEENPYDLPEIVMTVPPIEQRNDTIVYNAARFTGQEDRHLVDLLKKLPGLTVNDNGSVSYQGEAIGNFYIEGHDLLGGQYALATNNLPVDAVSQVEVLEHHQHAKVLKETEFSHKAALNIKLKQNRLLRPFGEIAAGAGGTPLLYNGKAFLTQIGSKVQTLVNLKANNSGINIISETENHISTDNLQFLDILPQNLIQPENTSNLPIQPNRYLFNRSYLGSINNLIPISKETEMKINISHTGNREEQQMFLNQTFATGTADLNIAESTNRLNKALNFAGSVAIEHNSSKKFIKNELKTNIKRNNNNYDTYTDETNRDITDRNTPSLFQNSFQTIIKYGGYKTFKITSFLRYLDRNEALNINSGDIAEQSSTATESFGEKFWLFKNTISTTIFKNLDAGLNLNCKSTAIGGKTVDTPVDIDLHKSKEYHSAMSFSYQLKSKNRITATVNMPLNFYRHIITAGNSKTLNKFIATPSVSNHIPINYLWSVSTRLGYDWDYGDFLFNMANQFLRTYRTAYIPSNIVPARESYFIATNVKFKSVLALLFFDIGFMYRLAQYNYMPKTFHTAGMSFYTTESRNNSGTMFMINTNVSKTFTPIQLALTITPNFTQTGSMMIQQDNTIKNKSNLATLALKAELKKIRNIYISYRTSGKISWQDNNLTGKRIRSDLEQRLALFYFPKKNIDLSVTTEYTLLEMDENRYTAYTFTDLKGRLKLKSVEFELALNNIMNNKTYSLISFSSVNSTFQRIPLRGREFILSASLNF